MSPGSKNGNGKNPGSSNKQVIAYIGLGSNLQEPRQQIKQALQSLRELPETQLTANAGFYLSKPMGPSDQPDYVNSVAELETSLSAHELLDYCQQIEAGQGRARNRHWGERTIDLDILLYGDLQVDTDRLVIPHPGIAQRDFVYLPLLSLAPGIHLPGGEQLNTIITQGAATSQTYDCRFDGYIE